jgi:hypothetical protein
MSYKKGTYVSLLFFAVIGVLFYTSSVALPQPSDGKSIGPSYFPELISLLLIVFCIISFFTTIKKNDEHVELSNPRYIIFTIILSILFVGLWGILGLFYVVSFVIMTVMIYFYNQAKHSYKKALKSLAISFAITILVYVVFDRLLNFSL